MGCPRTEDLGARARPGAGGRNGNAPAGSFAPFRPETKARPERTAPALRPLLALWAEDLLRPDWGGASAEDEAEAAEQQSTCHQRQRGDEKRPLAQGFFSSAARAFS